MAFLWYSIPPSSGIWSPLLEELIHQAGIKCPTVATFMGPMLGLKEGIFGLSKLNFRVFMILGFVRGGQVAASVWICTQIRSGRLGRESPPDRPRGTSKAYRPTNSFICVLFIRPSSPKQRNSVSARLRIYHRGQFVTGMILIFGGLISRS